VRSWAACATLAAALCSVPAAAQKASEAESHVTSAFTSGADHGILAQDVALGPVLRRELGGETDSRRIYNLLIARTAGKAPSVTPLAPGEAASHASLPGVNAGGPMFRLAADGMVLLLQYATAQRSVTFVELLVETPATLEAQPAPVTTIPLPTEAPAFVPPAAVVAPAPIIEKPAVRKPAPAPVVHKPQPAPVAVPKAPPPAPGPRGECVIKPVMSDEDMRNCAAPSAPRALPQEAIAVRKPAAPVPAAVATPKPKPDCVIKPVMTDEELRACGSAR